MSVGNQVIQVRFGWLKERLEKLAPNGRAAFAAACTERLMPSYRKLATKMRSLKPFDLDPILRELWQDLSGEKMILPTRLGKGMRVCLKALEQMGNEVSTYHLPA